jgi:hypothetical protein
MVRSIFDIPEISILPVCEHMTKKSVVIRPCCHFAACLLANGIRGTWYYLGEKVFQLTRLARGLRSQLHSKAELHSQVRNSRRFAISGSDPSHVQCVLGLRFLTAEKASDIETIERSQLKATLKSRSTIGRSSDRPRWAVT